MLRKGGLVLPTPAELGQIALSLATQAGQIVLRGWRSRPAIDRKGRTDLVTEYDLASERFLRERLRELTPELGIVAEEEGGERGEGPVWYCDPLDGTTNFVHGHFFWAVSLGVLDQGVPIAGAVVAPALGTWWMGHTGGVAERNGTPCRVSETGEIGDALVATGFPYTGRDRAPENNFSSFARVKQAARAVRRCGSAALDVCLVADGTYDAYWERALKPWDVVGGLAVALAAGAKLTALDGSEAVLERGNLLLTNGRLHPELIELVLGGTGP
jgi:myo-inositol-1(or 4)-monophosphatase